MKSEERKRAILLRKQGVAMGEIAKQLKVAKSSVSYWVRDVQLSKAQNLHLKSNSHTTETIEKRRSARLLTTDRKRAKIKEAAMEEAVTLVQDSLWCVGVALYWGEGGKTQQTARVSNSDPAVIKTMMRFFCDIGKIPDEKFRGHLHAFEHTNLKKAEKYWSEVSGIPTKRFYKSYIKQSAASKKKRNTLPYGTFQIYVHDSDFFFRLMAWIEFLKQNKL